MFNNNYNISTCLKDKGFTHKHITHSAAASAAHLTRLTPRLTPRLTHQIISNVLCNDDMLYSIITYMIYISDIVSIVAVERCILVITHAMMYLF